MRVCVKPCDHHSLPIWSSPLCGSRVDCVWKSSICSGAATHRKFDLNRNKTTSKMTTFEHTNNLPLAGDILDDFAIIFRELLNKVYTSVCNCGWLISGWLLSGKRVIRIARLYKLYFVWWGFVFVMHDNMEMHVKCKYNRTCAGNNFDFLQNG